LVTCWSDAASALLASVRTEVKIESFMIGDRSMIRQIWDRTMRMYDKED
jgi:hypothetical protein